MAGSASGSVVVRAIRRVAEGHKRVVSTRRPGSVIDVVAKGVVGQPQICGGEKR